MIDKEILLHAFRLMCTARSMAETYEANRQVCKYVHATSRGHEAIQLATAFQMLPCDYVSPYYRDESYVAWPWIFTLYFNVAIAGKG